MVGAAVSRFNSAQDGHTQRSRPRAGCSFLHGAKRRDNDAGPVGEKTVDLDTAAHVQIPPPHAAMAPSECPWRRLMVVHRHKLERFIQRHIGHQDDAEDLAQQAFLEAVTGYAHFRQESELSTWLYGIAKNLVRNYLARSPRRRYEFCSDEGMNDALDNAAAPEETLERAQQFRALSGVLGELPRPMSEALWLVAVEGLTYEGAAQALSIPIGTVRSRVSRARSQLRLRMEQIDAGA